MELFNHISVFLYSLMIGSFLNVVIYRLPKQESITIESSHCLSCNTKLKWYHNIPLFSWLFLRGKCSFCKEKISIQYPLVEFTIASLGVAVFSLYGIVSIQSIMVFLSLTSLFALSIIDLRYKMVPDSLNLIALLFAWLSTFTPDFIGLIFGLQHIIMFMGGFILLKYSMEYILGKELLGEADIIVAGTMGALLGPALGMTAIFLSAIISAIPSIFLKIKYRNYKSPEYFPDKESRIVIQYLEILKNDNSKDMKNIVKEKLEKLYYKLDENNDPMAIPYIPFLFLGLMISLFFNINFYQ